MVQQTAKPNGAKGRIPKLLWVDDDPNVINAVYRGLRPYLINVVSAYHGMQGIWLAITEKPDLIVTDLSMPFATGSDLIATLSNNPITRHTPLLVVTGLPPSRDRHGEEATQVVRVFQKPTPFEELLAEIKNIVPLVPRFRVSSST